MVVVIAGLLLMPIKGMALAAIAPAATVTSKQAQGGKQVSPCHPGAKNVSGCAIRFVIPPPHIIVGTSSIKIDGVNLPIAVRVYMIENALRRPWSSSVKNRGLMVCRWASSFRGSRIKDRIHCETNEGHAWAARNTRETFGAGAGATTSCASAPAVTAGVVDVSGEMADCIMAEVVRWANAHYPSTILSHMSNMPRAGSDYTVKVKKKGQVTSKWVFEKGRLVAIWHKRQKSGNGNHGE